MKVTLSNIAWQTSEDEVMYSFLQQQNAAGIEMAPTRIFPENPYEDLEKVREFKAYLKQKHQLEVCSLQAICFGKSESIFKNKEERYILKNYIKKAIDFAETLDCKNLVFGSPKNRIIGENQEEIAKDFFYELGEYAKDRNTVLALEPNPEIYGTNFITQTHQAFDFAREVNSKGLQVNIDLGTIIENNEKLDVLKENHPYISHIHISEPFLEKIKIRDIHNELKQILLDINYNKYISIEMKSGLAIQEIQELFRAIQHVYQS